MNGYICFSRSVAHSEIYWRGIVTDLWTILAKLQDNSTNEYRMPTCQAEMKSRDNR